MESVGTRVLVQSDGTWELELQVPREVSEIETDSQVGVLQTVNDGPGSVSTINLYHAALDSCLSKSSIAKTTIPEAKTYVGGDCSTHHERTPPTYWFSFQML